MPIFLKSGRELKLMRQAGRIVAEALQRLRESVRPGISTADLDRIAYETVTRLGAQPAFLGYRGYPASLCASINDEIVHGIPSPERILREGDLISLDFGSIYQGYYGDAAITVPVGENVAPELKKLLEVTEASLYRGIAAARIGNTVGDVGAAVQELVEANGFSVVREFVGHGIGTRLHEDPQVPNYGVRGHGARLREGMVLAIEPMVNAGGPGVRVLDDKWTAVTEDGRPSAHFEHCVAVTKDGPVVLTD